MVDMILPDPRLEMPELFEPGRIPVSIVDCTLPHLRNLVMFGGVYTTGQDLITGRRATVSNIITIGSDYVETNGLDSFIDIDLGREINEPFTLVAVFDHLSGVVDISLLDRPQSQWTGWYISGGDTAQSTNNNSFDGVAGPALPGPSRQNCLAYSAGLSGLSACRNGGDVLTDNSRSTPGGSQRVLTIGGSYRNNLPGNFASVRIKLLIVLETEVPKTMLRAISNDPTRFLIPA